MASVTLKGNACNLAGTMPTAGQKAPAFNLVRQDLSPLSLADLKGKTTILLTVPSLDTPVCQAQARKFNEKAASLPNTAVVVASSDLPFAIKRFCAAEGLQNVLPGSDLRDRGFAERWGVAIKDGPLQGVTARAAFVIGPDGNVKYSQLVPEIAQEPDYDAILKAAL